MPTKPEVLKERRANDPEYAERVRGYARAYRERNKEKERERQKEVKVKKRSNDRDMYNAYMREWNSKNRERLNKERRERLKNDPEYAERIRLADRERNAANPEKSKESNLKLNYGITLNDYKRMLEEQNNCCKICGIHKDNAGVKGLVVDHCHNEGHIRGLLCGKCNTGLGQFKDDISLLQKAIEYLSLKE